MNMNKGDYCMKKILLFGLIACSTYKNAWKAAAPEETQQSYGLQKFLPEKSHATNMV